MSQANPSQEPAAAASRKTLGATTYRDFIAELLRKKGARNYLEIGVRDGATLAKAECHSIGVDPNFTLKHDPLGRKRVLHLYQMTSDEFFRDHDPRDVFRGSVDVAFLDGLHLFEYLLRDFINTERTCDRRSVILLDDCLPPNIEMTERTHRPEQRRDQAVAQWWTGDVWKVVSILRELRPELRITPVDVRPTGSIMVSNLDPDSTVLYERYFQIIDRYRDLQFTPDSFETYWTVNRPVAAETLLHEFDLSLYIRA